MSSLFLLWMALLAAGCRPQAGAPLTAAQQAEMVKAHNAWRAKVGVPALRWSADLADTARSWAGTLAGGRCRLEHSDEAFGENLFFASALRSGGRPQLLQVRPGQVVGAWASESVDYSYASNSCARGKECGHYTQIVWKDTREVGCGMSVCSDLGQIWVCEYRPAGNVVGQRPY